ncbi:PREDICTED: cytochrome P450 708A2-like [Tarenaya hassleriana]|uniref:cytochrome P450 708A2-like n=1 Tax=Tarenaya hassleriana TaxID=28532 RepID=UPI00053C4E0B|nr:PREDICTED: cytochrome P450 708A2-like [Tarenaya hassleriana]
MVDFGGVWPVIVSLVLVKICHWFYRWRNPKCRGKLPPGKMGFPIIGETFQFMKPHDLSRPISPFLEKKTLRYGPVFRTSLFGAKVVMSTDPEVNMEMAKLNSRLGAIKSLKRLFGENNVFLQTDDIHRYVRSLTFRLFGSESLKCRIIHDLDSLTRKCFEDAAASGAFDVKETAANMMTELAAKKVMGEMEPEAAKELELCWRAFRTSWFQFPFTIPGTTVYKFVKARKRAMKILKELVRRKEESKEGLGDFLDIVFGEMDRGGALDIQKAVDLIFTFFVVAQETTPGILAATVKLIAGRSDVMQELQREHERIVQSRADKEAGLTWEEYKSMTFTHMVVKESLRFTSAQPTVHRTTAQDIEIGGYTMPAGWIFLGIPLVHFDQETYEDPFAFNPWRWKGKDLQATLSKSFMPFGAGPTHCVGAEFAKLAIGVFVHHLSQYSWSMNKETRVLRSYTLRYPSGCKVQISKATEE